MLTPDNSAVLTLLSLNLVALCAVLGVALWAARHIQAMSAAAPSGLHVLKLANAFDASTQAVGLGVATAQAHASLLARAEGTADAAYARLHDLLRRPGAVPAPAEPAPAAPAAAETPAAEPAAPPAPAWDPAMMAQLSSGYSHQSVRSADLTSRLEALEARMAAPPTQPDVLIVPSAVVVTPIVPTEPAPAPAQTLAVADPGPTVPASVAAQVAA